MLADRLCQLLTAYVDGELSARQRKAVRRLLAQSAEARALLQKLQGDADQLRGLPRLQLAAAFSEQVLHAIADRNLRPTRRPRTFAAAGAPAWPGLAAAAAVLLVISGASYFFFASPSAESPTVANRAGDEERRTSRDAPPEAPANHATAGISGHELLPAPRSDNIAQNTPAPRGEEPAPETAPPDGGLDTILAVPTPKMELFPQIADARLALILSLAHLSQPERRKELADELRKDAAYRIELPCQEGGRGIERLRVAFQAQGIRLVIDQQAQDRLKRKVYTNFALYVENVTRDEVARVLRRLAADDEKAKPRRQFDQLILQRMTAADFKEVAALLGVDAKALEAPKARSPRDVDLHQPLAKDTAAKVEEALKGQGTRPAPGKPAAKAGERLAVVVPYNPVRPRAASPQVKQFLESRKDRQPDTVQLVLVLRGGNG